MSDSPIHDLSVEQRALVALRRMRAKLDALEREKAEPIAVIGMGCRFPGGADSPEAFWQLLKQGVDAVTEVPAERWDANSFYDQDAAAPGKMNTRWGAFLPGVDRFDPYFFGISPREAVGLDPQQRLWLEVAWEALEDAGQTVERLTGSETGVFAGVYNSDYSWLQLAHPERLDTYGASGSAHSLIANHLSYLLDLRGPSVAIDTACSSSLVAVHLACQSLRNQECRLALAGGVNLILSPWSTVAVCKVLAMASDGRCKTFDARADGIVRGEGCGVVVLKRLSDAVADGDSIWALIRGSAVNQDGRSAGLTAPNLLAQEAVLRQALSNAAVAPEQIGYIEAHGTGTTLGDPIEVEALANVVGQPRLAGAHCALGSVKSNLGHLEAAAGIAGLIKTVLALRHRAIPPHLHFRVLNPNISFDGTPFVIPTQTLAWPSGTERCFAGVSSFGIGGTNAHVVLEEGPDASVNIEQTVAGRAWLLPLSARSPEALRSLAEAYRARLENGTEPLLDFCYSASVRRSHHPYRLAAVGHTRQELVESLASQSGFPPGMKRPGPRQGLVFVFSGQGAQWAGMGRQLLAEEPVFRQMMEQCEILLREHASWSLLKELAAEPYRLENTEIAQPVVFAVQMALVALWRSWGIEPDAVVGHSAGEVAAACVAGALSLADGMRVACHRGRLMQRLHGLGGMAAVALEAGAAAEALDGFADRLSIAAINGPATTVFSGNAEVLADFAATLKQRGVGVRPLTVPYAFHHPQTEALQADLQHSLAGLHPVQPTLPIISTAGEGLGENALFDAHYWARNMREPVQFRRAIETLVARGHSLFLEIGAHPVLCNDIAECLSALGQEGAAFPSLRRERPERAALLASLGKLYTYGHPIDWSRLYPEGGRSVRLPAYPWQRERFWIESDSPVTALAPAPHNDWLYEPQWQRKPRARVAANDAREPGRWLILADRGGVGAALAAALDTRGANCTLVFAGEEVPMAPCRGIVNLWSLDAESPMLSCQSVLNLVQAMARAEDAQPPRLWIVADPEAVAQAPVWGLARVIALEHPDLWGGIVGQGIVGPTALPSADLAQELLQSDGEDQVTFRDGQRHVLRLVRAKPPQASVPASWRCRPDGTYLITGGLGGLGLQVARWLIEQGARHLVLAGRSGPSDATRVIVAELASTGAEIVVAQADVSQQDQVARLLTGIEPPLCGVFHAAGVLDDGVILRQDWERFAKVLAPKIDGAWNLHTLTRGLSLDCFVLFSSAAAVLGSPGQSNYAAANSFLDALAHHRRTEGLPALSINWGPWSEVGMATDERRLAARGMTAIPPTEGLRLLGDLLRSGATQAAVLAADWPQVLAAFPAGREPRVLADLAPASRPTPLAPPSNLLKQLTETAPRARQALLLAHLREQAGRVLSLDSSRFVDPRQPLNELGLDSLMAVELRNALNLALGRTLPVTLLFDYPTLEALASHLAQEFLDLPAPAESPLIFAQEPTKATAEPIAIIGMGCRFPGGANDPEAFWRILRDGVDTIAEVPRARWDADAYYDPDPDAPGKMSTRWGGFIEGVDQFDPHFFGIAPREAAGMDPQQRLLLEVCWEALERAGQSPDRLSGSATGVFMGLGSNEYGQFQLRSGDPSAIDAYWGTGNTASVAAGRISYILGLRGPSLAVDTACSSSLVALHLACQSLRSGECHLALAGGVSLMLSPEVTIYLSRMHAMASDGRCKTFDAAADGYVRGEGCGVVVLKRLSEAQAAGDPIVAVIRGSAVNHDGRSGGLTAPNGPAQQAVIRSALSQAGVAPAEVSYVETHGTGTPLGDPIEVQALAAVLGPGRSHDQPLFIGSVKTNVGHLEAAAGIVGLIKAALALQHREIPPHLHFRAPNPYIAWEELPVSVATERMPWTGPRIVGLSSFGVSGTNAHVILEAAPAFAPAAGVSDEVYILPLSARHPEALRSLAHSFESAVGAEGVSLHDICYTAAVRRSHHQHRLAVVGQSGSDLASLLHNHAVETEQARPASGKLVFVFPGQGAQWFGMGRQLLAKEPVFREALEACAEAMRPYLDWPLLEMFQGGEELARWNDIEVVQPALFAIEVGLAALWRSWGIEPDAVVGHSMGEIAAAHIAGILSLADAARIICRRSHLLMRVRGQGAMALVELSLEEAQAALEPEADRVSVAVSNSPRSTVLAGDPDALGRIMQRLETRGVFCRWVKVDVASHSPQMDPLRSDLLQELSGIEAQTAAVPFYSTVGENPSCDASYWVDNLRQPVRFWSAIERLISAGHTTFLELSPHPILGPAVEEGLQERKLEGTVLGSLRRQGNERAAMLDSLAQLYALGYNVDWGRLYPAGQSALLPAYPWQHARYWIDQRPPRAGDAHPLLGRRLRAPMVQGTLYESEVSLEALPFLADHRVFGAAVFPATAYLEAAQAAAGEGCALEDVVIEAPLVIPDHGSRTVQVFLNADAFEVFSLQDEAWTRHASGKIAKSAVVKTVVEGCASLPRLPEEVPVEAIYDSLRRLGLEYGACFRGLQQLWRGDGEAVGRIRLPGSLADEVERYTFHPALLDACFHVFGATLTQSADMYLPMGIQRFECTGRPGSEIWCHARRHPSEDKADTFLGDLRVHDGSGRVLATVEGLVVKRADRAALASHAVAIWKDWLYEVRWQASPLGSPKPRPSASVGTWLIFADAGGIGRAVAERLEAQGETCCLVFPGETAPHEAFQSSRGVVHLWSLDVSDDPSNSSCESALELARALAAAEPAPRLWLVTRGAQPADSAVTAPEQAPLWGLARVIASEHPALRCVAIDLDPGQPASAVDMLWTELMEEGRENQVAFRGTARLVARLVRSGASRATSSPEQPVRLEIASRGVLDHLTLRPLRREAPGPGQVELEVHATGLIFRDILNALGLYPGEPGPLGAECAGKITAVGDDVSELAVGDEVIAIAPACFASFAVTRASMVVRKPASLGMEEAATLPSAFLTAIYALEHVARLQPGERILIHAAAGGVGLAAVQLAQRMGAEVFATAGNPEKRAYLQSLGVPYILNSRSLAFAEEVLAYTGGAGVDVVLNSLAGEYVARSLAVVKHGGRFVELGKRDPALPSVEVPPGVAYHSFDLAQIAQDRPDLIQSMLRELVQQMDTGTLRPLPHRAFPLAEAVNAFRYMAQARHIGKIVLVPPQRPVAVRADATYLITGGLGALGLQVARHLVELGARHLVLAGRHAASEAASAAIAELVDRGAEIVVRQADVAQAAQVEALLAKVSQTLPPLRGIIHAAVVLDDGLLASQTWERFAAVLAPKVAGTWNLHRFTQHLPLDFFVLFSSAAGLFGNPGQANYAAANAFLDAFAHYRRAQGLPAVSLDWGPWAEVGLAAARGPQAERRWAALGVGTIAPSQGLQVLNHFLAQAPAQVAVLPVNWTTLLRDFAPGSEPALFAEMASRQVRAREASGAVAEPASDLMRQLQAAPQSARRDVLIAYMSSHAVKVLGLNGAHQIDPQRPLNELGLDSLMALELRNKLSRALNRPLPATLLFNYPTLKKLADHLLLELTLETELAPIETVSATDVGSAAEPIAIIGMGCRFPGSVHDPQALWQLLSAGIDAITEIPAERWDAAAFYDPDPDAPGKMSTRCGGFLDGIDRFDSQFFGIAPREAVSMDPQQRLLLEVCWEALEHAGQPPDQLAGSSTGVFVGISSNDYGQLHMMSGDAGAIDPYWGTGNAASVASGRISYVFGLQGPSMAVDTACSSSLVAIHLACQSLRSGECNLAMAAGVNLILAPEGTIYFSKLRALAPDGRCKTFDAAADGFTRSEGCGVLVLKRLSEAIAAGDPVHAVIRGSAVNQDGRSGGLTAPNGPAQQAVIRGALAQAGVAPGQVQYVEAHGTGTALGDPIEVQALQELMSEGRAPGEPLVIGSVKTNLGHTEAAAGIAGVIKVVLALEHREIPPHLHFHLLNPHIELGDMPLVIPTEPRPWRPGAQPRLAGVSSFGFSGTNAHVVIEEAPPRVPDVARRPDVYVLPVSARSRAALEALAVTYAHTLTNDDAPAVHDLCYSASLRRGHYAHRLAAVGGSAAELAEQLKVCARGESLAGQRPRVVFVFSGQGGHWLGMGKELLASEPVFRAAVEACAEAMRPYLDWPIVDVLRGESPFAACETGNILQPAVFAMQIGLAALWRSWGIESAAVVGHSLGEIAAAHVAGILSLEDAARIVCRRSGLMHRLTGLGGTAIVELNTADAKAAIDGHSASVVVGASNSPRSTLLSGASGPLQAVLAGLEAQGVYHRRVKMDVASHSPQMDAIVEELREALEGIQPRAALIPFYSTVLAELAAGPELDAAYWARNVREPVQFWPAVEWLAGEGHDLFLELGPHPLLTPAMQDGLRHLGKSATVLGSLRREEAARPALLRSLASLYTSGAPVAWSQLFPEKGRSIPLPSYPWQRERFWLDVSHRRITPHGHPLLGAGWKSSVHADTNFWESELGADSLPWLEDHRVQGTVVLPAAGYIEMALAAAAEAFARPSVAYIIEDLTFHQPLMLSSDAAVALQVVLTMDNPGASTFRCSSRPAGESSASWTLHASGIVRTAELVSQKDERGPAPFPVSEIKARCSAMIDGAAFYQAIAQRGLQYGPAFQRVIGVSRGEGEALGSLQPIAEAAAYQVHPALLDAALQILGAAMPENNAGGTYLPVGLQSVRLYGPPASAVWSYAREGHDQSDVFLLDAEGHVVLEARGLRIQRLEPETAAGIDDWFYALDWLPQPRPQTAAMAGRWLVLAVSDELTTALEARGASCVRLDPAHLAEFPAEFPCRGVVHFASDAVTVLSLVQALAQAGWRDAPRLWLITRGAMLPSLQADSTGLFQSPIWGLGRTIALEHAELRCTLVDLSPESTPEEIGSLADELTADDVETQLVLRGDTRSVARLVRWSPESGQTPEALAPAGDRPFRLEIDKPGVLDRLTLRAATRRVPGPGEVEIRVAAAALNFNDVLKAMGLYPDLPAGPVPLGGECTGTIVALGAGVEEFSIGDEVMAMASDAFGTFVTTPAPLVALKPARLGMEEAATLPVAFMTAIYALRHLARLSPGERVLIHAAAGGVGLAAVQVAQQAGAEILATAGSPEKRAYLESLGIRHVMDSRSLAFADEVMAITGGRGVDVVLNSLAGDAMLKSLELVAPYGRFLELGKRDLYSNRQVGLWPFRKGVSYLPVDLGGLAEERPVEFSALWREVTAEIAAGIWQPLPHHTLSIGKAVDAFREMAQGRHTGKIVLTFEDRAGVMIAGRAHEPIAINTEGTYLITGGLGALGLTVARWLVEQGVRSVALVGRHAPSPEALQAVTLLEQAGARVLLPQADVSQPEQLASALKRIDANLPPLCGVIHAAGIVDDGLLLRLDPERFRAVMAPKMAGAWNLHTMTRRYRLDCFVMFSSAASLLGAPGQGNYAAANAFLDGLAHFRRAHGLAALSINWGPWAETGMAAARPDRGGRLALRGIRSLTPLQGLEALDRLMKQSFPQVGVLGLNLRQWREFYPKSADVPLLSLLFQHDGERRIASGEDLLRHALMAADAAQRLDFLETHLKEQLGQVLRLAPARIDRLTPLTTLGLDSLMALELRNRLEASSGLALPATLVWNYPSIAALAPYLAGKMGIDLGVEQKAPTPEAADDLMAILGEADRLAEDQLRRLAAEGTN